MKKAILLSFSFVLLTFIGCAAINKGLDKIAPDQVDVTGAPIPGTRTATPITADTAGMIPYGSFALNGILLIANLIQRYKADKVGKGLKSTIQAIEQAANDPATADAIAKLKLSLSNAHQIAGVQPLINDVLEKV